MAKVLSMNNKENIVLFTKYQAAGNDFILLDNRRDTYHDLTTEHIQRLCDRRFGIGADGLITIDQNEQDEMIVNYRNADGTKSLCGNGSLCAVKYIEQLLKKTIDQFIAFDGQHFVNQQDNKTFISMSNVPFIKKVEQDFEINTGSPHYVHFVEDVMNFDLIHFGKKIRYDEMYHQKGINVNVVQEIAPNHLLIRTYERGVEDETLSCGTGATACALTYAHIHNQHLRSHAMPPMKANNTGRKGEHKIFVQTRGHKNSQHRIEVSFNFSEGMFSNIQFYNHTEFVFHGTTYL